MNLTCISCLRYSVPYQPSNKGPYDNHPSISSSTWLSHLIRQYASQLNLVRLLNPEISGRKKKKKLLFIARKYPDALADLLMTILLSYSLPPPPPPPYTKPVHDLKQLHFKELPRPFFWLMASWGNSSKFPLNLPLEPPMVNFVPRYQKQCSW